MSYKVIIRTDHKWKPFKYRSEVPARVLAKEFDWATPADDYSDNFICYRGSWTHLSQYTTCNIEGWQGVDNWSWSNGAVIRVSQDGEKYQIGYYYLGALE